MTIHHVTPERIASYLSRTLSDTLRYEIEDHLGYCEACRKEVASASRFVNKWTPRRTHIRWMTALLAATAALMLLLIGGGRDIAPLTPGVTRGDSPTGIPSFDVVAPSNSATVDAIGLRFIWRAEIEDPFYTVHLLDELGNEVWSHPLADTSIVLPDSVQLEHGQAYFWYVDALLRGVQTSTTGIYEFFVAP